MSITNHGDFFLDFQRFGDLKAEARADSREASQAVARQFEGLLVQQMLAAMRSAARVDESQHSSYLDFYNDMYDKQLAQTIAGQDNLGVARLILEQLPGTDDAPRTALGTAVQADIRPAPARAAISAPIPVSATPLATPLAVPSRAAPVVPAPLAVTMKSAVDEPTPAPVQIAEPPDGVRLGRVVDDDFAEVTRIENAARRWREPLNFVADILPGARAAAGELGVSPTLLVAQAALETGWGRHTMKVDDGRDSYNLFGIKASAGWNGDALSRKSLEFTGGAMVKQLSRFRAYASPEQSFADYVDFIRSNPRYRPALDRAGDDNAYIRAIHEAGYATDPNYADKVLGIMNGDLLRQSLAALGAGDTDHA